MLRFEGSETPLSLLRNWRRRSDSNRCIEVLQTSPLPLGYAAPPSLLEAPSSIMPAWMLQLKRNNRRCQAGFWAAGRGKVRAGMLCYDIFHLEGSRLNAVHGPSYRLRAAPGGGSVSPKRMRSLRWKALLGLGGFCSWMNEKARSPCGLSGRTKVGDTVELREVSAVFCQRGMARCPIKSLTTGMRLSTI